MIVPYLTKIVCLVCCTITVILPTSGAPRGRNKPPQMVYDQKQTGDTNIQLHLKDFQIIALLGEDSLGGDYDYSYDYSDFTVKPTGGSTTTTPTTERPLIVAIQNSTSQASSTTLLPSIPSSTIQELSTTAKPHFEHKFSTTVESQAPSEVVSNATEKIVLVEPTTKAKLETPAATLMGSPDKIKVQIIQSPANPSLEIIPPGDPGSPLLDSNYGIQALGEVMHYKRCAAGYSRDKRGRCRRVRKPGVPNLGRLASNLAAKFRQATSEEDSPLNASYSVDEEDESDTVEE